MSGDEKARERQRRYRDRLRGGPPVGRWPADKLEPCGSIAAARRHERAGVRPSTCALCGPVWAAHQREQYLARKSRGGTV